MTKIGLEKKIAEMQEQFDKMQDELNKLKQVKVEEPKKRWKPQKGDSYYSVTTRGEIVGSFWDNDEIDDWRYLTGNVFKTEQDAMEYKKKLGIQARFRNFVEEQSDELDWKNDDQCKYYLYYNYYLKEIEIEHTCISKHSFQVYASSKQILRDAIAEIGEENIKKYVLEV